jgi:anti-sigma factor ChrR (cupin superfamily)
MTTNITAADLKAKCIRESLEAAQARLRALLAEHASASARKGAYDRVLALLAELREVG